jgi:O-antigen ligase
MGGGLLTRTISADPFETWRFAYKLMALTLTFGLLIRYGSTQKRLRTLVYLVVAVALASAAFGLIRPGIPPQILGERLTITSSYAQFEGRNHFALLVEMAIGLLLGLGLTERSNRIRLTFCVLAGAILWTALLLTHSRGAVISLLLEVPFFFILINIIRHEPSVKNLRTNVPPVRRSRGRQLIATLVLTVLLLATVGASVVLIGGEETISRFALTRTEFTPRSSGAPKILRPQIWQATLKMIKDNPLLGVGLGGYSMAIPRYLNASGEWQLEQAHNDYLELAASGGAVGCGLVAWFIFWSAKLARHSLRTSDGLGRALRCGAITGLFAAAVHSLFDFGLHITINALVCSILIVLVIQVCNGKRAGSREVILQPA